MPDSATLNEFIVEAKAATYVGGGVPRLPCRPGAHDIGYERGAWRYLDSYFGGTDFAGQEVVWLADEPVWAMNYFGCVIASDLIDGRAAGAVIMAALSAMYRQGRFLGGMEFDHPFGRYIDRSDGDCKRFSGHECIMVDGREAYMLDYRGGLIIP
ncbi:hypothetical protein HJB51_03165 [Rhizobium lentis]|uniref:DUF5680 domain-containing protein n=1 Tax=Rhizobium lentis TaxID=1138194 RepID=UPI001C83B74A|nr:DUF5680 domain-containing protein [Rhizobium lentis]MBX5010055.1 hypothetical protein [Rhizobium lentis]MBX5041558.1 hypothetical protein [Rhizobium lentis]MBX5051701.1 hypothetical protein [Rhizobium lentis]MBX5070726.1 hypothetical protein [Rhizobium lentis]MBX5107010.1 hypothetical protein [Rhizobium lentis]